MPEFAIRPLEPSPGDPRRCSSDILVETVANGGSVSFMHPLDRPTADAFWDGALAAAARGERIVLGAWDGEVLVGTVTLLLDCPPNQPHRAEIAKMMTRAEPSRPRRGDGPDARGRGARRRSAARTLLMLDTADRGRGVGALREAGVHPRREIPDYALKPHGGLTGDDGLLETDRREDRRRKLLLTGATGFARRRTSAITVVAATRIVRSRRTPSRMFSDISVRLTAPAASSSACTA